MQKLLISLGLDLADWKSDIDRAKAEFRALKRGVANDLKSAMTGGVMVAASAASLFALTEKVANHSRMFEKLQTRVKAADSEVNSMKEDVYDLNAALGLRSVEQAAGKMGMVAKMSKTTGTELKELTYQTGLLNKFFGDEEGQLKAQIALMRAYKLPVEQVGDAVAYLNKQGGDIKGELLESLAEYSVQFAEAGFSIDQTIAILKKGLGESWNVDKAADAIKEGRLRLMGGDKATVDALDLLGVGDLHGQLKKGLIDIPDAFALIQSELGKLDPTTQFSIAKDIFGAPYEDVGAAAMGAMLMGMNEKVQTSGAIDLLTNTMNERFSYKWDKAVSKSTNSFSRMLDELKPHLVPIVEWFGKATESVSGFSRQYRYLTKTIAAGIVGFILLTALLGGFKVVAGIAAAGFKIVKTAMFLAFGPLFKFVAIGALVVGALIVLEQKTGILTSAWRWLKRTGSDLAQNFGVVKDAAINMYTQGFSWESIKQFGSALGDWLIIPLDNLGKEFKTLKPIIDGFKEGIGVAFEYLQPKFAALGKPFLETWEQLKLLFDDVLGLLQSFWKELSGSDSFTWQDFGKGFGMVVELAVITPIKIMTSIITGAVKIVRSLIDILQNGFTAKNLSTLTEGLKDIFFKPFEILFEADLTRLFLNAISGWGDALLDTLMKPINTIRNSKLGKFLGLDQKPVKVSARQIRESKTQAGDQRVIQSGKSLAVAYVNEGDTRSTGTGKQVSVHIRHYHSNSKNAAADWEEQGLIGG